MEQKSLLFIFSSAAPQRTAYSKVPSQMAAHLRTGSPLYAGEIAGFEPRAAFWQSGVATSEPPLLPKVSYIYIYTFLITSNILLARIGWTCCLRILLSGTDMNQWINQFFHSLIITQSLPHLNLVENGTGMRDFLYTRYFSYLRSPPPPPPLCRLARPLGGGSNTVLLGILCMNLCVLS